MGKLVRAQAQTVHALFAPGRLGLYASVFIALSCGSPAADRVDDGAEAVDTPFEVTPSGTERQYEERGVGHGGDDDPAATRNDSGSTASLASQRAAEWRLTLSRVLPTAPSDPTAEPLVYNPQYLYRFSDGTLVVGDAAEYRVVVIDSRRPRVLARFGRRGGGPGEVRGSAPVIWSADGRTILVADEGNRRISRFTRRGELMSEVRYDPPSAGTEGQAIRYNTGELFAVVRYMDMSNTTGDWAYTADSIARVDLDSGEFIPLVGMPRRPALPPGARPGTVLFHPRPLMTVLPSGGIITGRTDQPVFRYFTADGSPVREVHLPLSARPIGRDDELAIRRAWGGGTAGASASRTSMRISSRFYIYNALYAIGDSVFALQHSRFSHPAEDGPIAEGELVWRVVSVSGEQAGMIRFPKGFAPRFVDDGRIVGLTRDSLGVATITEFVLNRPRRRGAR